MLPADPRNAAGESRLRPRGSNHARMRQFNERVVLHAIRLNGSVAKADIARLTHLTPQTVQVITARLEAEGLVRKLEPVRGRVGQPSVPMALDPDGAFSIGIKIGRRSLDLVLLDFVGRVRERSVLAYPAPDADHLFDEIDTRLQALVRSLAPALRARLHGVGVAAPLSIGGWESLLGITPHQAARWADIDIRERVGAMTHLPVDFVKDTAAACVAELVAGRGLSLGSFLYVFIDTFIGGGLVIDSQMRGGPNGNAGAVGSFALGLASRDPGGVLPAQLLSRASLVNLSERFIAAGLDADAAGDDRALRSPWHAHTDAWCGDAAPAIAFAVQAAACLLDLEGVVIDGCIGRATLGSVMTAVDGALDRHDWRGATRPQLFAGSIGADASAMGGALLPLYENFAPDRETFLKLAK